MPSQYRLSSVIGCFALLMSACVAQPASRGMSSDATPTAAKTSATVAPTASTAPSQPVANAPLPTQTTAAPTLVPTATSQPTSTLAPTSTSAPIKLPVIVRTTLLTETKTLTHGTYTITTQLPALDASMLSAAKINAIFKNWSAAHSTLVAKGMREWDASFKPQKDFATWSSAEEINTTLTHVDANYLSVRLYSLSYLSHAAHPSHELFAFNVDVQRGVTLTLQSQFKDGARGLDTVAKYARQQLLRDFGNADEDGVAPKPENYLVWNMKPEGLLITFQRYQVGPYALGNPEVLIPRSALADVIAPGSALDRVLR